MTKYSQPYRGRFAPSPTGPLHFGSLFTALGSYLQAKNKKGKWLVRIEDLDPPREIKGAAESILYTLENYGLHWDEDVVYQSQRYELYEDALTQLKNNSLLFNCTCSRKRIKESAEVGPIGFIYPGTCRDKHNAKTPCATRIKSDNVYISLSDLLQGDMSQNISLEIGDVTLKRADNLYAYHLAVVIDDYHQGITEIVRGYDLYECTPTHIFLQQKLNYPTPRYLHLPILVNEQHKKLSKQTKAPAISNNDIEQNLVTLLTYLNQNPPEDLRYESKEYILNWAIQHWNHRNISGKTIEIS